MSLCPVSLLYLEGELDGWRKDYLYTELLFYLEEAKCFESIVAIDKNIDALLESQLNKGGFREKVLIDEQFCLLDKEITAFSHDGDKKFGLDFEPLVELTEALRTHGDEGFIPTVPKSVYYATLGIRCMTFFDEKGNNVFLTEAYKSLGYADQEYWLEIPAAERQKSEKIKAEKSAKNLSLIRSNASISGHAKRHNSWKPYVQDLYENTDWNTVLKTVNRSRKVKYIAQIHT